MKKNILLDYDCQKILETLPMAVYACDVKGNIIFYNDAAVRLWGREPVFGKDLWHSSQNLYYEDGTPLPPEQSPLAVSVRQGTPVTGREITIERPNGERSLVLPHPTLLRDHSGNIIGAVNLLMDITERKVQETRKNEARYHQMIGEVQDYAILLLDKAGNIQNWNKGAEKIKGYKEEEILGKNFRIFYGEEDRTNKLPEHLIHKATTEGRAMHEGWRFRKDGKKFWGSVVITALHNEKNEVIGFTKVTRDLTERKLAEDQLSQKAQELELRNRELEQFAYVASHDLQEPLRKIQVFSGLLEKNYHDQDSFNRFLGKINSSARRMSALIRDILQYSKLTKGDDLKVQVDLNGVLKNVLDDFELVLEQKQIRIHQTLLPVIKGIPIQFHQLLTNLVGNAIKFSTQDPLIEITSEDVPEEKVKAHPELQDNRRYVTLMVRDNGMGFDPQYTEDAFKLFKRLQDTEAGTGIGLALCKKIVENHEGIITVTTQLGAGTSFFITLPVS